MVLIIAILRPLPFVLAENNSEADGIADPGEESEEELAMELQNPIASLISVPIQNNWDFGIGAADAMRYTANIQPVIPFSMSADWNLITRTILPVIYAESPVLKRSGRFRMVRTFVVTSCPTSPSPRVTQTLSNPSS